MKARQGKNTINKRQSTVTKEFDIKLKELEGVQELIQVSENFLRPEQLIEKIIEEINKKAKDDGLILKTKEKAKCIVV
jgi:hypothetical protein